MKEIKFKKGFCNLKKGWQIYEDDLNRTSVVFLPEPIGGCLNKFGRNVRNQKVATIIEHSAEALSILSKIGRLNLLQIQTTAKIAKLSLDFAKKFNLSDEESE